jgi:hypothetical protein
MKLTIGSSRLDTLRLRSRPAFMERDMVVPSWEVWDGEQARERRLRYRYHRSVFPLGVLPRDGVDGGVVRDTPTYDGGGGWGVGDVQPAEEETPTYDGGGARGGVNEVADDLIAMRRRELMGSDVNFTGTLILVLGCVLLFVLAVSPWGVPPPNSGAML